MAPCTSEVEMPNRKQKILSTLLIYHMIKRKQKRLVFNVTVFLLVLIGCTTNQHKEEESLSLKLFSLQKSSSKLNSVITESDDGYHGKILSDNLDTIYFNFGYDIDNLSEK